MDGTVKDPQFSLSHADNRTSERNSLGWFPLQRTIMDLRKDGSGMKRKFQRRGNSPLPAEQTGLSR